MSVAGLSPISMTLNEDAPLRFAAALGESFGQFGFAVVSDHAIEASTIESTLADMKALFALPDEVKRQFIIPSGRGQRGYTPLGVETAKGALHSDLKEFWHVGREPLADGVRRSPTMVNIWPTFPETFRANSLRLYADLEFLGKKLLRAIARNLQIPESGLEDAATDGDSILRLIHYPPATFDGPHMRAGPHEDINAITLLLGADERGLEILTPSGEWLAIEVPPGCIVVNIGDMLARLTNDVLRSTTHRVVNPAVEREGIARYSMPFFLHFRPDFSISTLPQCVSAARPDRYPTPVLARDFLAERLREIGLA